MLCRGQASQWCKECGRIVLGLRNSLLDFVQCAGKWYKECVRIVLGLSNSLLDVVQGAGELVVCRVY
jgi:hypothetical protein